MPRARRRAAMWRGPPSAPSLSVTVDPTTNRLSATGTQYDNNGNLLLGFGGLDLMYDLANRLETVQVASGNYSYAYDADNRRIYYRNASGAETVYFYGADGTKLATYTYAIVTENGDPEIQLTQQCDPDRRTRRKPSGAFVS